MKNYNHRLSTIVFSGFFALYLISGICSAQETDRKGKFEFFGMIQGNDTIQTESTFYGQELRIDGGPSGGFGFGYNFNENLNVNTTLFFAKRDIELNTLSGTLLAEADADMFIWDINLDYYILKDPFTPMIACGLGVINLEGTYNTGQSFDESNMNWNLGAGFRWDISEKWFLKLFYKRIWTEFEDADDESRIHNLSLNLGYKF